MESSATQQEQDESGRNRALVDHNCGGDCLSLEGSEIAAHLLQQAEEEHTSGEQCSAMESERDDQPSVVVTAHAELQCDLSHPTLTFATRPPSALSACNYAYFWCNLCGKKVDWQAGGFYCAHQQHAQLTCGPGFMACTTCARCPYDAPNWKYFTARKKKVADMRPEEMENMMNRLCRDVLCDVPELDGREATRRTAWWLLHVKCLWDYDATLKYMSRNQVLPRHLAQDHCTYSWTGESFSHQVYRYCFTCDPDRTHELLVCGPCSRTCHDGHELSELICGPAFCDCGHGALPSPCRLQVEPLKPVISHVGVGHSQTTSVGPYEWQLRVRVLDNGKIGSYLHLLSGPLPCKVDSFSITIGKFACKKRTDKMLWRYDWGHRGRDDGHVFEEYNGWGWNSFEADHNELATLPSKVMFALAPQEEQERLRRELNMHTLDMVGQGKSRALHVDDHEFQLSVEQRGNHLGAYLHLVSGPLPCPVTSYSITVDDTTYRLGVPHVFETHSSWGWNNFPCPDGPGSPQALSVVSRVAFKLPHVKNQIRFRQLWSCDVRDEDELDKSWTVGERVHAMNTSDHWVYAEVRGVTEAQIRIEYYHSRSFAWVDKLEHRVSPINPFTLTKYLLAFLGPVSLDDVDPTVVSLGLPPLRSRSIQPCGCGRCTGTVQGILECLAEHVSRDPARLIMSYALSMATFLNERVPDVASFTGHKLCFSLQTANGEVHEYQHGVWWEKVLLTSRLSLLSHMPQRHTPEEEATLRRTIRHKAREEERSRIFDFTGYPLDCAYTHSDMMTQRMSSLKSLIHNESRRRSLSMQSSASSVSVDSDGDQLMSDQDAMDPGGPPAPGAALDAEAGSSALYHTTTPPPTRAQSAGNTSSSPMLVDVEAALVLRVPSDEECVAVLLLADLDVDAAAERLLLSL